MIKSVEQIYTLNDEKQNVQGTLKTTYTDNSILYVPKDTANRHYQEILEWVANGGTIIDNGS